MMWLGLNRVKIIANRITHKKSSYLFQNLKECKKIVWNLPAHPLFVKARYIAYSNYLEKWKVKYPEELKTLTFELMNLWFLTFVKTPLFLGCSESHVSSETSWFVFVVIHLLSCMLWVKLRRDRFSLIRFEIYACFTYWLIELTRLSTERLREIQSG